MRSVGRKRLQQPADGRPTVHTVAARAGVSIASASRVLNGVGGSPETVRKVRAAAAEVGYVPNAIARSLQSQRTGLVALAVEDIGNPVYVAMMRAIEAVVAVSGRQLWCTPPAAGSPTRPTCCAASPTATSTA